MSEETKIPVTLDSTCIARLSGQDEYDLSWIEFETDWFAGQLPANCSICGEEITAGWLCLDGGEEVCATHVNLIENKDKLRDDLIREWTRTPYTKQPVSQRKGSFTQDYGIIV